MSIFVRLANVRTAQTRLGLAQRQLGTPAAALLARGRRYPLTTVGAAAGAGFVIGSLDVHPLRVPGVAPLLGGGLAEAVAIGTRLITELGIAGLGGTLHRADPADATDDAGVAADASASA
jgi:hypothetical protein